jgi:Outer membrane protein beta-barrel domain
MLRIGLKLTHNMKIQLPLFRRIFMISKTSSALKALPLLLASAGILVTTQTSAAITTDARGNTAYDTAAECDAAVQNGTARFYQPEARNNPLLQKGEKSVKLSRISDLGDQYRLGACDLGVGKQKGRVGVDRKLQGKYVPFSPSMPLNTYLDANGNTVRVSMQGCDNRFSAAMPRAVALPMSVAVTPAPAPVTVAVAPPAPPPPPPPVPAPPPMPEPAPVVVAPPAAAPTPPPPPPPAPSVVPYVFGAIGVQKDAICHTDGGTGANLLTGQVGAGVNFTPLLGAEVFAQASRSHTYNQGVDPGTSKTSAIGARLTVGTNVSPQARIFGKVGAAYVNHKFINDSKSEARPTLGVGFTYDLTPALSLRGDADIAFKRSKNQPHPNWGNDKYLGIGVQYKF